VARGDVGQDSCADVSVRCEMLADDACVVYSAVFDSEESLCDYEAACGVEQAAVRSQAAWWSQLPTALRTGDALLCAQYTRSSSSSGSTRSNGSESAGSVRTREQRAAHSALLQSAATQHSGGVRRAAAVLYVLYVALWESERACSPDCFVTVFDLLVSVVCFMSLVNACNSSGRWSIVAGHNDTAAREQ
jgi:hypothetical protein